MTTRAAAVGGPKKDVVKPARARAAMPLRPVRGSKSGRPIMALLDLLGRRWTLRVLWELRERTLTFRELKEACDGMSMSVLNERLSELRQAGVVESSDSGYRTTETGRTLLERLAGLDEWAKAWARRLARTTG